MESIKIVSGCRDTSVLTLAWIHGEQKENDYAPLSKYEEAVKCLDKIDKVICVSKRAMDTVPRVYQRTNNLFVVNNPNDAKNTCFITRSNCTTKEEIYFCKCI